MRGSVLLLASAFAVASAVRVEAAELNGIFGLALAASMKELAPEFERTSGHRLTLAFEPPAVALKRMRDGEAFDVAAFPAEGIENLEKDGRAPAGASAEIARSQMGLGVAKGAPRVDVSSPETLKRSLSAAKAVTHSDPARGGVGGLSAVRMFARLGIAEEMRAKTVYPRLHSPEGVAREVTEGRADIAINLVHEIVQAGLEVLGPFPGELRQEVAFRATLPAASRNREAAQALIDYLRSPPAQRVFQAHGLAPATR